MRSGPALRGVDELAPGDRVVEVWATAGNRWTVEQVDLWIADEIPGSNVTIDRTLALEAAVTALSLAPFAPFRIHLR